MLIHVHAQHEAHTLLSGQAQLDIIDAFADQNHEKDLAKIASLYAQKIDRQKELDTLRISEEERLCRLDFAQFQSQELENAGLKDIDEDEQLEKRHTILANVSQLDLASGEAYQALAGDSSIEQNNAIDIVQIAISNFERGSKLDEDLNAIVELFKRSAKFIGRSKR